MITRQAAVCTGLISGDVGRLANHDTTNASALLALAVSNLARRRIRTTAIGGRLIGGDVLGTCDVLTGTGLITRHFLGATHFITGDPVAVGCRRNTNLGWCCSFGCRLAEGLEDLRTQIFRTGNRTARAGFVASGLHRAIGLRTGDDLSRRCLTFTHFPMGISSSGLLRAVTVGSRWTRDSSTLIGAGTRLGTQLTNLLGEFAAGEVWIGLTGHCSSACRLLTSSFSMF